MNLAAQLRAEAKAATEQLNGVPGVVADGIRHLASLCSQAAIEIERGDKAWKAAMEERKWWEDKAAQYRRMLPPGSAVDGH